MRSFLISALFFFPLAPAVVGAQEGSDVLTGRVTDLTGRPVADAQIIAISTASGARRTQTTDVNGHYKIYFQETAPKYLLTVKRIGFSPVSRTVARRTAGPENMAIDLQFGGTPLALSAVEVSGGFDAPAPREVQRSPTIDTTVPNPLTEILSLRDTLHLSAVQVVALSDLADSLQKRNTRIYGDIRMLLARSQEAGDPTQMAGSVAMMLEEASKNTFHAIVEAGKILRPEQWTVLPPEIRDRRATSAAVSAN
ncbi:MAG: carboxypeptidase-like regulatory domain-containing protein [Gemmatimonadaceae bacterium]